MRQLSRVVRAGCSPPALLLRRPVISAPPSLAQYPTTKGFTTSPAHHKYQVPKRKKQEVVMAADMTTFKGKPFDRAALESLMKVGRLVAVLS